MHHPAGGTRLQKTRKKKNAIKKRLILSMFLSVVVDLFFWSSSYSYFLSGLLLFLLLVLLFPLLATLASMMDAFVVMGTFLLLLLLLLLLLFIIFLLRVLSCHMPALSLYLCGHSSSSPLLISPFQPSFTYSTIPLFFVKLSLFFPHSEATTRLRKFQTFSHFLLPSSPPPLPSPICLHRRPRRANPAADACLRLIV